jgi:hypothetical protein
MILRFRDFEISLESEFTTNYQMQKFVALDLTKKL